MKLGPWSRNVFCVKINQKEFDQQPPQSFFSCKNLIVTRGKNGAVWFSGLVATDFNTQPLDIKDVSGLGDVFGASLAAFWLKTGSLEESIKFANKCCSISAKGKGVYVPSVEEIKNLI